jgi:hypothetical protein
MALDHARTTFYVVRTTSAEFGLQTDNKKFSKEWNMNKYTFKYMSYFTWVFFYASCAMIYPDTSKNL